MSNRLKPSRPALPATLDSITAVGIARRPLMLAICGVLLGGVAQAQSFPPEIDMGSLDGNDGFVVFGDEQTRLGASVSWAGDINGDGIDDLIIGAPFANPDGAVNAGEAYVVFGTGTAEDFNAMINVSSLNGSNGFRIKGAQFMAAGISVAGIGDINGDGIDDVIIGAPRYGAGASERGAAYVVFGRDTSSGDDFPATLSVSDLDGTNGFRLTGQGAGDRAGFSVSAAGDFDGDGIDDVIVGVPGLEASFVVFGKDTAKDGDFPADVPLTGFTGPVAIIGTGLGFGSAVASAGDINGDGVDDVVVGTQFGSSTYVVFGNADLADTNFPPLVNVADLDGSNGFRLDGVQAGLGEPHSMASAGDVNGDSIDDLIVGGPYSDVTANGREGQSFVVFGRDTSIDGISFPAVLSLTTLDGTDGFRLDGEGVKDYSGASVASAGDVNGDGIDDLIVGAPGFFCAPSAGQALGHAYVVFGRDTSIADKSFPEALSLGALDGTNGFRLNNIGQGCGRVGASVAAGDINGDGFSDLIIGAPYTNLGTNLEQGSSYIVFGGISGPGEVPQAALDATTLEFGDIAPGDTAIRTLMVENSGTGTLSPGELSITGGQAGEFSIELNSCFETQLANGETCSIDIGFAPIATGIRQATLSIRSNAQSSPDQVQLRGNSDALFADSFEED